MICLGKRLQGQISMVACGNVGEPVLQWCWQVLDVISCEYGLPILVSVGIGVTGLRSRLTRHG
jgi:hypothetical protein